MSVAANGYDIAITMEFAFFHDFVTGHELDVLRRLMFTSEYTRRSLEHLSTSCQQFRDFA